MEEYIARWGLSIQDCDEMMLCYMDNVMFAFLILKGEQGRAICSKHHKLHDDLQCCECCGVVMFEKSTYQPAHAFIQD